jgi:hypothetical protein
MTSSVPALQQAQKAAEAKLAAFTDVDAFSALGLTNIFDYGLIDGIPAFQQFLATGDLAAFEPAADGSGGYAALSGLNSYFGTGDITGIDAFSALGDPLGTAAFSAIPVFQQLAAATTPQEAAIALGGYDALSATDTFFGDGPPGFDPATPVGAVFGPGGVDALAPHEEADGTLTGGYQALSALPVFFGSDAPNTNFGPGVFNPQPDGTGGISALSNYAALSAVPAYLNIPPQPAPLPVAPVAPLAARTIQQPVVQKQDVDTSLGAQPLAAVAPPADPAPADSTPPPAATKSNKQNEVRNGLSFKPEGFGGIPLFGSGGGAGVDNSIKGYGDMLKKAGLSGGETAGAPAGGASASGTP